MQGRARRRAWSTALIITMALVLDVAMHVYPLRLLALDFERFGGTAVPPSEAMQFPEGTELLRVRNECTNAGNGGCWSLFTVRPPIGEARVAFEDTYLVEFGRVPGTLWDPQPISVSAKEFGDDVWVVRGDYRRDAP
ncbi:hypothetical protein EAO79_08855 [Plantibacter sp. PA-3-X8]|nr:hypothetical protein EAO79_08855 [Plantibacter sp. PA-3-X8]